MSIPKLTYFAFKGRAECIRLILAQAGVDFEDYRISLAEWPSKREGLRSPTGRMPVYNEEGLEMVQSMAIARYLARKHDLWGKSERDRAMVDMVAECIFEAQNLSGEAKFSKDEGIKAGSLKMWEATGKDEFFSLMRKFLGTGTYLVGDQLTYADIYLASFVFCLEGMFPGSTAGEAALCRHRDNVLNLPRIKAFLDRCPKSDY